MCLRGTTLFIISNIVPIVTKARMADRTGISKRPPSGLNGNALNDEDEDGEDPYVNSGVCPRPLGVIGVLERSMPSNAG